MANASPSVSPELESTRRRRGWGIFGMRGRNRLEPAPPIPIAEADPNHNEINSNYLPSMEPAESVDPTRLYPSLEDLETDALVEDRPIGNPTADRNFFDANSGFLDAPTATVHNGNEGEIAQGVREDFVDHAPDSFTAAAQNDYNSEVERIMQESRQLQADRILSRQRAPPVPNTHMDSPTGNLTATHEPFPVEVDLVGVEASTSLFLLGIVLLFISRAYALIYLLIVSYLLYRVRAQAHQAAQGRAAAQARIARDFFFFPVPQFITDLREAMKLIVQSFALLLLIPWLLLSGVAIITRALSSSGRRSSTLSLPNGPDCKFLLQLMFFPLFIPYWLSKLKYQRPPPTRHRSTGVNLAPLWAVVRFLGNRRRR